MFSGFLLHVSFILHQAKQNIGIEMVPREQWCSMIMRMRSEHPRANFASTGGRFPQRLPEIGARGSFQQTPVCNECLFKQSRCPRTDHSLLQQHGVVPPGGLPNSWKSPIGAVGTLRASFQEPVPKAPAQHPQILKRAPNTCGRYQGTVRNFGFLVGFLGLPIATSRSCLSTLIRLQSRHSLITWGPSCGASLQVDPKTRRLEGANCRGKADATWVSSKPCLK